MKETLRQTPSRRSKGEKPDSRNAAITFNKSREKRNTSLGDDSEMTLHGVQSSNPGSDVAAKETEADEPNDAATSMPPTRPRLDARGTTMAASSRTLPRLKKAETAMMQKHAHPLEHLGITLGGPAIILFDIVVPCIIYYTWYYSHKHSRAHDCRNIYNVSPRDCPILHRTYDKDIMGYAIISFGAGELWILIARVWRLLFRTAECAPLLSRSKWELDATSWVYGVAMLVALVGFVVGSSLTLPHVYLYCPAMLMGFLGLLMIITTFVPFKIPIGINSHARGTRLRPFIYYAAEDFIAVDGLQDREFRERYNERFETHPAFRRFFRNLTLFWILGVLVYIGCVSAVIWTLPFNIAFGLSLGVLFAYIAIWAGCTVLWVKWEIDREHKAFEDGTLEIEGEKDVGMA